MPVSFNHSPQQTPPLPPSFTCPPLHERYAGPFLGTHAGLKWGPCCPRPLLAGRRHAWTHQLRIRLLLLGQSQGPCCSPQLQRATSVCVSGDEKRCESESAECEQRGPWCTLRTTPCCLSRRGTHAAPREGGEGDAAGNLHTKVTGDENWQKYIDVHALGGLIRHSDIR